MNKIETIKQIEIKNELICELEKLRLIHESARLHLANYFSDLRGDVDLEMVKKQHLYQLDTEKKQTLTDLWMKMIAKIELFEKKCINNRLGKKTIERINDLETLLLTNDVIDLEEKIKREISNEENRILNELFKNKSIFFVDIKASLVKQSEHLGIHDQLRMHRLFSLSEVNFKLLLTNYKLVIVNDEFINYKAIKQRLVIILLISCFF